MTRAVLPVAVHHADGLPLLGPLRAALSGAGPAVAPHAAGHPPDPAATAPLRDDEDDPADPVAAVVSTTGSTGRAKHVLLPASALLASAGATHDRLGGAGRWLLAVPAHTVAGVQVLVRSLVAGTTPVVQDLADGFTAAGFVAACEPLVGRPGRRYTSLVPTQLGRLLDDPAAVEALRAFDAVLVGGAALTERLRDRARATGVRVVTTYGMTETCGGCVYDGLPLPGVRVGVQPHADDGALPGRPGVVVLSGPVVARGYRDATRTAAGTPGTGPDASHDASPDASPDEAGRMGEGFAVVDGVRVFRTADLGVLDGDRLVLHGRVDDVVVCGGTNVSLDAVTRLVRTLPDVADALAVGLPDPAWGHVVGVLVQPADGRPGPDAHAVPALVRTRLGRAATPRVVRSVTALPLTGVGKPDRRAAARLLGAPDPVDARAPGSGEDGPDRNVRPEEPTA